MIETSPRKVPNFLILSDIDGVLIHDNHPLENAKRGITKLMREGGEIVNDFPIEKLFYCLTNGGGQPEAQRAKMMNHLFETSNFFNKDHMFLAHTVIGRKFIHQFKEKRILVIARDRMENLLEEYGFKDYVFIWDFLKMHPYLCPYSSKMQHKFGERHDSKNELYVPPEQLPFQKPFEAVMVLENPPDWNDAAQVICDLLLSDGRVGCNKFDPSLNFYGTQENYVYHKNHEYHDNHTPHRNHVSQSIHESHEMHNTNPSFTDCIHEKLGLNASEEHQPLHTQLPIIFCNPDLTYSGEYNVPRFTQGAFKFIVQQLFKEFSGKEISNLHQFGKPLKTTYDFVKECMQSNLQCKTLPERIYMIGDNPKSDIKGGNEANMFTILVRTGNFKGAENDNENPANFVCDNFEKAIEFILKREKEFLLLNQH